MLASLSISNYAIIDELNVGFDKDFNVITGETGAGKSIMLGALGLIIGSRADTSVLFNHKKKCFVEATFNLIELGLESFFQENDLDFEQETIIRREISSSGKSRAFINDTPVTLQQLKKLTKNLIDIHSQHQTLQLNASDFQFNVLDSYAGLNNKGKDYQEKFKTYNKLLKKLSLLIEQEQKSKIDLDYFQFQLDELLEANLKVEEQSRLEDESTVLNNADNIKEKLYHINDVLTQDRSPSEQLRTIVTSLSEIKEFSPELNELYERVNSVFIELDDFAGEANILQESFSVDEGRLVFVNNRLDELYKLQQKHRVSSTEELIVVCNELELKLANIEGGAKEILLLEKEQKLQLNMLLSLATEISVSRKEHVSELELLVEGYLAQLGMEEARIEIKLTSHREPSTFGIDEIEILFSANKGGILNSIAKVASGGELSRLMLSIKTIISSKTALPTIIFDEIDTGVSGIIADKMADIMKQLSKDTQVFSITHLPQIAAKGVAHYVVYKDSTKERTYSNLKRLNENERVEAIAKMLSGEKVTQAAMDNATELLS
jgi:DNA repair protein RecN (Recombination protein N)